MAISISTIPLIVLLSVYSVISVDVDRNKHVEQESLERDDKYNLNHPPLNDEYDEIVPVTKNIDDIEEKEGILSDRSDYTDDIKIPKSVEHITKISKPKARSLSLSTSARAPVLKDKPLDSLETSSVDKNKNKRRRVQRKRLQQVRKTEYNQATTTLGISETTTVKAFLKEDIITTQKTVHKTDDAAQIVPISSKKRTRTRDPVVPIIESENYVFSHRGNFHYSYEGGDGTRAFERGELKQFEDGGAKGEAVEGSFSYTDKDGNDFSISYTADENGYRPVGAHLPTPPPIPPEIQAALRLLATKTTPEPVTERISKYS